MLYNIQLSGRLNEIAQLSSVLYLLSYSAVNISCLCLDLSSAPNFRPNFRHFHWSSSLVGMLGCGLMIFLIRLVGRNLIHSVRDFS